MTLEQVLDLAMQHHQRGQLPEAEGLYRQVLAAQPNQPDALHLLGMIALQVNRPEVALELIRKAIEVNPGAAQFHCNLGQAYQMLGRVSEAVSAFRQAVMLRPDYPEANYNLGTLLQKVGEQEEAVAALTKAIASRPSYAQAHNNLGNAYRSLGRLEEAGRAFEEALRINPSFAEACNNLGNAFISRGSVETGISMLRKAIGMNADYASAHFNLGVGLLLLGDMETAWPEYEWRWKTPEMAPFAGKFSQPRWTGEAIEGKTILLHVEQALGDMIQFCRYVPMVAARGARAILQCPPPLASLLGKLNGVERIATLGDLLPSFDLQCPLLNLPRIFNTALGTIPADVPYLSADPERSRSFEDRMMNERPKVGIAWAGRALPDPGRSLPFELLRLLFDAPNVSWYSLQKAGGKPATGSAGALIDWTDELQDFSDTAALIENLDLVISVDTAVAHLAGALGKPTWTLLPFAPDWRWMLNRNDSPWYPTMRLFRQPQMGDWPSVIEQVKAALGELKA